MTASPVGRATPRERFAWCLFDFANSAFNTIVVTFVFPVYFAAVIVGDRARGEQYWAWSLTVAGLVVAALSPVLGDFADRTRHKKGFLVWLSAACIAGTAALYFPAIPADSAGAAWWVVLLVLVAFTFANTAFEIAFVFYNAFLPGLASRGSLGRLSGKGWAFGYVGGLLCLWLCLQIIGQGDAEPWVTTEGHRNVRTAMPVVAVWFALFALPMFLWVRDRAGGGAAAAATGERISWRASVGNVLATLRELPRHPDLLRFFVARLFYNDATIALIGLAGIYMAGTLNMPTDEIVVMAIWLNIAAGIGAFGFGYVDDFLGARVAVIGSLVLLLAGSILAIAVPTPGAFQVAATMVGLGLGPNQAASRTLLARLIDPVKSAQFYGLYALSGKATAWLGPLLFGIVRGVADDQRVAMLPLIAMFAIGLVLLWTVDERRGRWVEPEGPA